MANSVGNRIKYMRSLIRLSETKIPRYPVYQKGNPQLRIFLPQFWMKMVKPEKDIPPDRICFIVHPQMSKVDIKNYLEKIYKVSVAQVKTDLRPGKEIKHPVKDFVMAHEDDYKMAFVYLGKDQTFEFPDIFANKQTESDRQVEEWKKSEEMVEDSRTKEWDKLTLPPWFR